MKPPQFQGGKRDDAYDFLTLSYAMLEAVVLVDSCRVRFMLYSWEDLLKSGSYMRSRPAGSPLIEYEVFSEAFQEQFIPWNVREERSSRFETLTQGGMIVAKYEPRFYQLHWHIYSLITSKVERVHRLAKGLTFSIHSYVFKSSWKGASF